MTHPTRRTFLASTLAVGTAASLARPATAAEPVVREGGPNFKLSLAAYSFNRMLARNGTVEEIEQADMRLEDVVDFAASLGLPGVELTGYYFPRFVQSPGLLFEEWAECVDVIRGVDDDDRIAYLHGLSHRCFKAGLTVSGTAIGNDFALPPGKARDRQIADCKHWIDLAAILGAPVIRIFAGKVPKGGDEAEAIERCAAGINECLPHAAKRGVHLALENHGGITATPAQMLSIIERVDDSPWFGVNFDSGNFQTDDPYRDLAKIAPYAINAQIKPYMRPNGKKEEPDVARVLDILRDADYRGWVALEYEGEGDPREEIPGWIERLRKLI